MFEIAKVIICYKVVKFREFGILFGISYYYMGGGAFHSKNYHRGNQIVPLW
jgi:hypothetical protein